MAMDRRKWLEKAAALSVLPLIPKLIPMNSKMLQKPIPSTGELLPAIGLGTWQTFDVSDNSSEVASLTEVLRTLTRHGGKLVDSSPMYGRSEDVLGNLSSKAGLNQDLFIATKVWTTGRENGIQQMNKSMSLLRRERLDLMQVHNLTDWETHLITLRKWKDEGRIRYIGITHYTESAYGYIEKILQQEPIDFLQINYSLTSRRADQRLFPLAMEKKVAVIINRPFEEGALFRRVKGMALPPWAEEFGCKSWGQFFLKFIISHPTVTCAIPGTSKPHHMLDNAMAGTGRMPDEKERQKMISILN
jgi:diketogulonate reductase-like aldo/keto reductase